MKCALIANKIKKSRLGKGLSQASLADKMKTSIRTVNRWETGSSQPTPANLKILSEILDKNVAWFFEEDVGPINQIPLLANIPEKFPKFIPSESIIDWIRIPELEAGLYVIKAKGDSMAPTIKDGDYVFFNSNSQMPNGFIAVINDQWGETNFRRYHKKGKDIFFLCDNPEFPTITAEVTHRFIGSVVKIWREIKF